MPFSQRFETLTAFQRDVYYVTLIATALSTACLIAPSAAHRLRFHQSERALDRRVGERADDRRPGASSPSRSAARVLLITDLMFDGARVWVYSGAVAGVIVGLWFVRPLLRQARGESSGP